MLAPARGGYRRLEAKWLQTPPPWPFPGHPKKSLKGKEKGRVWGSRPSAGACSGCPSLRTGRRQHTERDARKQLPRVGICSANPGAHHLHHHS